MIGGASLGESPISVWSSMGVRRSQNAHPEGCDLDYAARVLATCIAPGIRPRADSPRRIEQELRACLAAGARVVAAGTARARPAALLRLHPPRYRLDLFGARFYLADLREDENFRFFVAYVRPAGERDFFARLFYKDSSLVWRCATHVISAPGVHWIGKGDLKCIVEPDGELECSAEETTNLPYEMQAALDELSRRTKQVRWDARALARILRGAPIGRYEAYADFIGPRRRAAARRANRIHGGRPVAWFER